MCEVSDKLKLCSCKTEDVQKLKHYWILQRPFRRGGPSVMGTVIPPADFGTTLEKINVSQIKKQLNENSCFDADIDYKENDILHLYFTCNQAGSESSYESGYLAYAFHYKNGKWKKTFYDHFYNNLEEVQAGMIRRPFK
jgi:hypothetical protein